MRVKVVRPPGELRDSIGHRILVEKDWEGTVEKQLDEHEISAAGFHPKQQEIFYSIKFDLWDQPVALPATFVVVIPNGDESSPDD